MNEHFDDIGKQAGEQLEGYLPGLPDRIAELNFQQYGRALVIGRDSRDPSSTDKLVGYVLPLQEDQGKHLIVFQDGLMFVTEPRNDIRNEHYKNEFRQNSYPLMYGSDFNLSQVENQFAGTTFWGKVLLRSDNLAQQQEMADAIRQAVALAKGLKERRLRAKEETAKLFFKEIDGLLYPQSKPQETDPAAY